MNREKGSKHKKMLKELVHAGSTIGDNSNEKIEAFFQKTNRNR